MRITKESQIQVGQFIYVVHNVNNFTCITRVKVVAIPYSNKIDIRSDREFWLNDSIFLTDFGVGTDISGNRLYTTKEEAKEYIK